MSFDKIIKLVAGAGNGVDSACLMTASNMLIGKGDLGDEATCQCKLLRAFIIATNDAMPDDLRCRLYGPLVYEILGTDTEDRIVFVRRAFAFADWAIREISPIALEACGLMQEANKLRSLPAIDSAAAAAAAAYAAYAAAAAAYAAAAASDAAARAASDAAARAADAAANDSARAANAAAYAAADAADAAAAKGVGDHGGVWEKCQEIIRRVASIGDTRPVECVMTINQLANQLGAAAGKAVE